MLAASSQSYVDRHVVACAPAAWIDFNPLIAQFDDLFLVLMLARQFVDMQEQVFDAGFREYAGNQLNAHHAGVEQPLEARCGRCRLVQYIGVDTAHIAGNACAGFAGLVYIFNKRQDVRA